MESRDNFVEESPFDIENLMGSSLGNSNRYHARLVNESKNDEGMFSLELSVGYDLAKSLYDTNVGNILGDLQKAGKRKVNEYFGSDELLFNNHQVYTPKIRREQGTPTGLLACINFPVPTGNGRIAYSGVDMEDGFSNITSDLNLSKTEKKNLIHYMPLDNLGKKEEYPLLLLDLWQMWMITVNNKNN